MSSMRHGTKIMIFTYTVILCEYLIKKKRVFVFDNCVCVFLYTVWLCHPCAMLFSMILGVSPQFTRRTHTFWGRIRWGSASREISICVIVCYTRMSSMRHDETTMGLNTVNIIRYIIILSGAIGLMHVFCVGECHIIYTVRKCHPCTMKNRIKSAYIPSFLSI